METPFHPRTALYRDCTAGSPFGGIPRNWKRRFRSACSLCHITVPPSGGSLEIGNGRIHLLRYSDSLVPPSGGSLEIGNSFTTTPCFLLISHSSPFGGIPRNWKLPYYTQQEQFLDLKCSPFGGIPRNWKLYDFGCTLPWGRGSPFGGIPRNWKLAVTKPASEITATASSPFGGIPRNWKQRSSTIGATSSNVPPSGGSLEIGNTPNLRRIRLTIDGSPFGGIPRNWKPAAWIVIW